MGRGKFRCRGNVSLLARAAGEDPVELREPREDREGLDLGQA